jgi:hypothetical protein
MAAVRQRWLSGRAISLHLAVLVLVPGCALAAWWQVNRAQDGNELSYLYSVMWPVFGLLFLFFWWMLIHTDYENVGLKGSRRRTQAAVATQGSEAISPSPVFFGTEAPAAAATGEVDPELAAYNARLAELAAQGPKTWRHRESVVVRRFP